MIRRVTVLLVVALLNLPNITVAADEGPTQEDIILVQGLLKRLGYDPGPADGICGSLTSAAVRALHNAYKLPLQPGDIEPQAETVVKNLTSIMKNWITRPTTEVSEIYYKALEGNSESAYNVV